MLESFIATLWYIVSLFEDKQVTMIRTDCYLYREAAFLFHIYLQGKMQIEMLPLQEKYTIWRGTSNLGFFMFFILSEIWTLNSDDELWFVPPVRFMELPRI